MIKPKAFQQKTIEVTYNALTNPTGSRRFLVADEVGLGKTVVAQHVIHKILRYVLSVDLDKKF